MMERVLQGPINPCLHEENHHLDADYCLGATESLKFEPEEETQAEPNYFSTTASLDDNSMPFLQIMLHEAPPFSPDFQTLLRLQHLKNNNPWNSTESCVTQVRSAQETPKPSAPARRERRKRKRQRPTKNKDEVESQRMTHIAVERNRRRQMNDHLDALRSLMPTSYIQRGDQASIVGGAIDFVKELEQLLYSLEAQKRMRSKSDPNTPNSLYASLPRYGEGSSEAAVRAEKKSETAEIEVTVIQDHVNLKVECRRRRGQLVRAIVGLEEELRLTVLHLNITSELSQHTVLYSFNLKMEEDCGLGSVEEIASAVEQMFSIIHDNEIQNRLS